MVLTKEWTEKMFTKNSTKKVLLSLDLGQRKILISASKLSTMMIATTKSMLIELKNLNLLLFSFVQHGEEPVRS
jgi:hypothetical protein